jgi:hypothetical protein
MSKRHQASRRRSYGRRQHELREREDRMLATIEQLHDLAEEASAGADVAVRELGLRAYGSAYLGAS